MTSSSSSSPPSRSSASVFLSISVLEDARDALERAIGIHVLNRPTGRPTAPPADTAGPGAALTAEEVSYRIGVPDAPSRSHPTSPHRHRRGRRDCCRRSGRRRCAHRGHHPAPDRRAGRSDRRQRRIDPVASSVSRPTDARRRVRTDRLVRFRPGRHVRLATRPGRAADAHQLRRHACRSDRNGKRPRPPRLRRRAAASRHAPLLRPLRDRRPIRLRSERQVRSRPRRRRRSRSDAQADATADSQADTDPEADRRRRSRRPRQSRLRRRPRNPRSPRSPCQRPALDATFRSHSTHRTRRTRAAKLEFRRWNCFTE